MATTEQPVQLVSLTEAAAVKVRALLAEEQGELGVLRVAVQGGGCSGFQYALGFDREAQEGDHRVTVYGVDVVVDPFSAPYLKGTEIDFLDGLQGGFAINNPNASAACGCGHSFQVEDEAADHGAAAAAAAAPAARTDPASTRPAHPLASRGPDKEAPWQRCERSTDTGLGSSSSASCCRSAWLATAPSTPPTSSTARARRSTRTSSSTASASMSASAIWSCSLGLVLLILAFAGRVRGRQLQLTGLLFGLLIVQVVLAWIGYGVPAIGFFHPVNALVLFGLSAWLAMTEWRGGMTAASAAPPPATTAP